MTSAGNNLGVPDRSEVANHFMRGAIAVGLLSALQQDGVSGKPVLKYALQGGSAIAAGVVAAYALQGHRYADALMAIAVGAVGILSAEVLSFNTNQTGNPEQRSKKMSKKKWKKAYKNLIKQGYDPVKGCVLYPSKAEAQGWPGQFGPGQKNFGGSFADMFNPGTRQGQQFLLGALLGSGAAYVMGDEKLRGKLMKSLLKFYAGVAGGFEEFKEQLADLKAEIESENSGTE